MLIFGLVALVSTHAAASSPAGFYLCTVADKAGINFNHMPGSGGAAAFVDTEGPTTFKIQIAPRKGRPGIFRLLEVAYDGSDRSRLELEDQNSVLHESYSGDGNRFRSASDAFFHLGPSMNRSGELQFSHAGYEHPGGEDTNLAVRWGRCRRLV
jgi:hypothetical protein